MLYLNKKFEVVEREMKWGKLECVELGEEGRGRKLFALPVPKRLLERENPNRRYFKEGKHSDLTIGLSKSGKPRINYNINENVEPFIYVIIDSYKGYTRRGCGSISILLGDDIEELAYGNGADGDAGRIGDWDVKLLKIPNDGKLRIIKCIYSGRRYRDDEHEYTLFFCKGEEVDEVWNGEIDDYIDIKGIDLEDEIIDMIKK